MKKLLSIKNIELTPKPGKKSWRICHREWREEFIYFLMVNRFHDSELRKSISTSTRSTGLGNEQQLTKSCGRTIKGVSNHLEYIKELGCTAIWLSPILEKTLNRITVTLFKTTSR